MIIFVSDWIVVVSLSSVSLNSQYTLIDIGHIIYVM